MSSLSLCLPFPPQLLLCTETKTKELVVKKWFDPPYCRLWIGLRHPHFLGWETIIWIWNLVFGASNRPYSPECPGNCCPGSMARIWLKAWVCKETLALLCFILFQENYDADQCCNQCCNRNIEVGMKIRVADSGILTESRRTQKRILEEERIL